MPHQPGHVFDPYNLSPEEEKSRRLLRQAEDALAPAAMRGQLGERGPLQEFLIEQADEIKNITGAKRARITDPDAFGAFLAGRSDEFEEFTGRPSPMRQAMAAEEGRGIQLAQQQAASNVIGFPETIANIGGGQLLRLADAYTNLTTPYDSITPEAFRDVVSEQTKYGGGGNAFERAIGNLEQQIVGPGQALGETYDEFPRIPIPFAYPSSFNARTVVDPQTGESIKIGPGGAPITNEFPGLSTALVAQVAGDPLNVLPVVGYGGDIARGARAATGAVKRVPQRFERAAEAVGQTGVGNVLLPTPPVQQAARAADDVTGGGLNARIRSREAERVARTADAEQDFIPFHGDQIVDRGPQDLNTGGGRLTASRQALDRGDSAGAAVLKAQEDVISNFTDRGDPRAVFLRGGMGKEFGDIYAREVARLDALDLPTDVAARARVIANEPGAVSADEFMRAINGQTELAPRPQRGPNPDVQSVIGETPPSPATPDVPPVRPVQGGFEGVAGDVARPTAEQPGMAQASFMGETATEDAAIAAELARRGGQVPRMSRIDDPFQKQLDDLQAESDYAESINDYARQAEAEAELDVLLRAGDDLEAQAIIRQEDEIDRLKVEVDAAEDTALNIPGNMRQAYFAGWSDDKIIAFARSEQRDPFLGTEWWDELDPVAISDFSVTPNSAFGTGTTRSALQAELVQARADLRELKGLPARKRPNQAPLTPGEPVTIVSSTLKTKTGRNRKGGSILLQKADGSKRRLTQDEYDRFNAGEAVDDVPTPATPDVPPGVRVTGSNRPRQSLDAIPDETLAEEARTVAKTHVGGVQMGQNEFTGTFLSTEAGNRYMQSGAQLFDATVDIVNPRIFRGLEFSSFREQFLPPGVNIDDATPAQINQAAERATENLRQQGFDSAYLPEADSTEGILVVFDSNRVRLTNPREINTELIRSETAAAQAAEDIAQRAAPPPVRAADEAVPPVTQAAAPPPPVEPPPGQVPPAAAPEPSGIPEVDFIAASVDDLSRVVGRPDLPADKDPLTLAAAKVIREAKPLTNEAQRALAKLNKQKAARAGASARRAPSNLERGAAFARGLGGEVEGKTFEGIRPLFSDEQLESLLTRIWGENSPLRTGGQAPDFYNFDQFNADKAFQKLFHPDLSEIPAPFEIALLEKAFGTEFVRAILSKRSLGQKAWDLFVDIWNLPRATLATLDISSTLRQAAALGPGNKQVFRKAFISQLKAFAKESYAVGARERMRANPNFDRFTRKSGGGTRLSITDFAESTALANREEVFLSRLTGKIPGIRHSARAYTTMLNELRFGAMENWVKNIERGGLEATDEQLDAIATFINYATGRGPLGPAERALPILNGLMFSPRLTTSRFALPFTIFLRAPGVRKKVVLDLVSFALTFGTVLTLANAAPGVSTTRDGKIRIGKAEVDLGAGFLQPIRFVRHLLPEVSYLGTGKRTSSSTGTTSTVKRDEEILRFLRSKAHPSLGFGIDVITQKDFFGDEFNVADPKIYRQLDTRKNPALRLFTPLIAQDVQEAVQVGGVPEIVTAAAGGTLGAGVTTFDSLDTTARETYGVPYPKLWPFEKDRVKELFRAVDTGDPSEFDRINDQHLKDLNDLLADKTLTRSQKVSEYFRINTRYSGIRQGTSQQIFGDMTFETVQGGSEAQQAALQQYYDELAKMSPEPLDESVPSALFDTKLWEVTLGKLEKTWKREGTLDYVNANINRRPIPEGLFDILPPKTRARIKVSSDARAAQELKRPLLVEQQAVPQQETAPQQQAAPMPEDMIPFFQPWKLRESPLGTAVPSR